jgi:DNA-binding MarR family transcriptional regulator/N-acetylglutamate synthase-like GNAT family acetyltransferase
MNPIKELGELAYGTRLRLLTERFIQDGAKIYQSQNIDFEPRWFTVFYLLSQKSPLSISEITSELGFTQPAVTQIANILIKRGLVKVVKDRLDTRKKLLALSLKGLELLPQLQPVWKGFEEAIKELFKNVGYDMLLITGKIEDALDKKDMFTRVSEHIKKKQTNAVEIIDYRPEYKSIFRDLNYEWLNKYFKVEKKDRKILNDPEKEIINNGGSVFFARSNNKIVGTAALIKYDIKTYELAKIAVAESARGKQIGRKLANAIIKRAKEKKAKTLFLDTSIKLRPALNLYKTLGFEQIEFNEPSKYERSTIRMALSL